MLSMSKPLRYIAKRPKLSRFLVNIVSIGLAFIRWGIESLWIPKGGQNGVGWFRVTARDRQRI